MMNASQLWSYGLCRVLNRVILKQYALIPNAVKASPSLSTMSMYFVFAEQRRNQQRVTVTQAEKKEEEKKDPRNRKPSECYVLIWKPSTNVFGPEISPEGYQ